ncbi:MAG: zinc ribbon domain-containing protein [Saprospiraceae bacterium]
MKECQACYKAIPDSAKSCPFCGKAVIEETLVCPNCGQETDLHAPECMHCHYLFFKKEERQSKTAFENLFDTSHQERVQSEITSRFQKAFLRRLEEEHLPERHADYLQQFSKSDFKKSVDLRIQQLTEEVVSLGSDFRKRDIKRLLAGAFEELLDYFIIRECAGLNETVLPEAILKYQGLPPGKLNLRQMVLDYLDFDREEESIFTNFVSMPSQKLKHAADSFLFPHKGEQLLFICDLSILGTCKEGFAMTSECIYWKVLLEKPQRVFYRKLDEIKRQEDWITINGIFFNANKSINLKLIRLLKKLKSLMAE